MLVPTELTLKLQSLLDEHFLDILGNGSKCLDIMDLDLLVLDILGIILYPTPITLHVRHACAANLLQQLLFAKIRSLTNFVGYFNHILVVSVACLLCMIHYKLQGRLPISF